MGLMVAVMAVFPALAGINRVRSFEFRNDGSVPRASGDKPVDHVKR